MVQDTLSAPSSLDALHCVLQSDVRPHPLQRDIARPLATAFLEEMEKRKNPNLSLIAFGHRAVEALWPENEAESDECMAALKAVITKTTDQPTQEGYTELLAKLGHLHQLAGLLLRERELSYTKTPKTIEAFVNGGFRTDVENDNEFARAKDAVDALNAPRIELTFTAHPTNTNSLSNMYAQRELGKAVSKLRTDAGMKKEVAKALLAFANAPLLPEQKFENGPHGFTVMQETENMLYHLNAVYDDMDSVYKAHDTALNDKFGDEYKPETLALGVKFHSWGSSGDKDGNKNVNADTTLYSLAMHHQHILLKYRDALQRLGDPALEGWRTKLEVACSGLTDITTTIKEALDTHSFLDQRTHDLMHQRLQLALANLDIDEFASALEASHAHAKPEQKEASLLLLRHVRMFGRSFGTIEFRETAEEFTRIVAQLIPGYPIDTKEMLAEQKQQNEQTRQTLLNELLGDAPKRAAFTQRFRELAEKGAEKPYSDKDPAPIAYHTLKRLELARDFPQAIQNHVLAECQDTSNLLELLLLQETTAQEGKRATLGIVPLFEDREPLKKAPDILKTALNNKYYMAHVEAVAALHGRQPAQQIQLAHSDNARRNGLPAARALIYNTHAKTRAAMDEVNKTRGDTPIALQFYEGGSLTDSYRGGTRAISASINEFGIHDFAKMTVQGGDMLNYFNLPHSTYRIMLRNISNGAQRLKAKNDTADTQMPSGTARLKDEKIIAALSGCSEDYKQLFEGKGKYKGMLTSFLESIDFAAESSAGNASSRAGARSNDGKVDVTKARTISFSEGCQHAGLNPSWIGSLTLVNRMEERGLSSKPKDLHALYNSDSPLFKDVVDRMMFGLVRTDMDYLRARSNNDPLMERFDEEYSKAFKLCMEAYTGKPLEELTGGQKLTAAEQRQLLIDHVYAHTKDVFADQQRFTELMRSMKAVYANNNGPATAAQRMRIHNGMDTIVHGRLPLVDDPTYATLHCEARGIARPHVQNPSKHLRAA